MKRVFKGPGVNVRCESKEPREITSNPFAHHDEKVDNRGRVENAEQRNIAIEPTDFCHE